MQALGEEEIVELMKASVERSSDTIFWLDEKAIIIYANSTASSVLGYSHEELIGMSIHRVDPDFPPHAWLPHVDELRKAGSLTFESRHRRKDGTIFPVEVICNYFEKGDRFFSFAFNRDISSKKQVEQELQKHRENLEELVAERTAELEKAIAQLLEAEKLAALGQLVAGVAHELNTPLGNTRMVASSLHEELKVFKKHLDGGRLTRAQLDLFVNRCDEAAELLESNTARSADLIAQFKQVAIDQTSMRRRHFHLKTVVEELVSTMKPQFKHTSHSIEVRISEEIELNSYPGPLGQVLANLIVNSLHHGFESREHGLIIITAETFSKKTLILTYEDNGKGIPEEWEKKIFEPFFTSKLGQGGSGLGLYIVYSIVTGALSGTVKMERNTAPGVAFTMRIPLDAP